MDCSKTIDFLPKQKDFATRALVASAETINVRCMIFATEQLQ